MEIDKTEMDAECNKIVDLLAEKLIDLGYPGGNSINDIINKGEHFKKMFESKNVNKTFQFQTKLLDLPQGREKYLDEIEEENKEEGERIEEARLMMHQKLKEMSELLIGAQTDDFKKERLIVDGLKN